MSYYDGSGAGAATLTPGSTVASIAVAPLTGTTVPSGSRTYSATLMTSGGRVLSAVPTLWTISDDTNFSIVDNGDGTATATATADADGLTATVQAHYDSGGTHVTSADCSVVCSSFSGMSSAPATQLETLATGLSTSLTPVNHFVPGVTPLNEDVVTDVGQGWRVTLAGAIADGTILVADKPSARYGKTLRLITPRSPGLPIESFDRSVAPRMFLSSGADSNDLVTSYHWTHFAEEGVRGIAIRNWPGSPYPAGGFFDGLGLGDGIGCGIVDSSTVRLGSHVAHGGTHYVCILKHTVGASDTDGTEPGVGASWATYWSAVAALAVAPPAWALNTKYDTIDSTSWPTYSTPGQALLCYSGGHGTANIGAVPDPSRQSCLGNVEYQFFDIGVNTEFVANDNTVGDKAVSTNCSNGDPGQPLTGFIQGPGWGSLSPGVDGVPLMIGGSMYNVDRLNGEDLAGGSQSILLPNFAEGLSRGTRHTVEIIHKHPTERGDDSEAWIYVDGVQALNFTYRIVGTVAYAWRAFVIVIDNVRGGGGCMPIDVDNYNDYDEIYHARGVTDPLLAPVNLNATCEEGDTPDHTAPIHFLFELRDGYDMRMDCGTRYNPQFGSQQVAITLSGPGASGATAALAYSDAISGGMSGRIRVAVTGASAASLTCAVDLKRFANNDTWDSVTKYSGSKTVTPT